MELNRDKDTVRLMCTNNMELNKDKDTLRLMCTNNMELNKDKDTLRLIGWCVTILNFCLRLPHISLSKCTDINLIYMCTYKRFVYSTNLENTGQGH